MIFGNRLGERFKYFRDGRHYIMYLAMFGLNIFELVFTFVSATKINSHHTFLLDLMFHFYVKFLEQFVQNIFKNCER